MTQVQELGRFVEKVSYENLSHEAVTLVSEGHVPGEVYERVREHFDEKELVDLTMAVVAINGWNRIAISTRAVPGSYQPRRTAEARA